MRKGILIILLVSMLAVLILGQRGTDRRETEDSNENSEINGDVQSDAASGRDDNDGSSQQNQRFVIIGDIDGVK